MNEKAVVLLSGGLDSTTCATLAVQKYGAENVMALGFNYGQIHHKEQLAARNVAHFLGIKTHRILRLPAEIFRGTGSSLLGEADIPEGPYPDTLGPLNTYVPFRNGTLLSVATAISQGYNATALYFGAHSEDAANWAYPDCTPEFISAMEQAIWIGTYMKTVLVTPLAKLMKQDVVRLGISINAPLHLSWSCYKGTDKPCGTCPTCISRVEAFQANGFVESEYIALMYLRDAYEGKEYNL